MAFSLPTGAVQCRLQPARQQHRGAVKASATAEGASPGLSPWIRVQRWERATSSVRTAARVWKESGAGGRSQWGLVRRLSERRGAALLRQVSQSFSPGLPHPDSERVPQVRDRLSLNVMVAQLNDDQNAAGHNNPWKWKLLYCVIIVFIHQP